MLHKEKLAGPIRLPIKRILVWTTILLFAFPWILLAQEPGQPCNKAPGDSQLTSAACDQNENASGIGDGAGAPN
jgi:hypothetical protein